MAGNSSAQDAALAAKSVRRWKFGQKRICPAPGGLEWADSVTVRPKATVTMTAEKRLQSLVFCPKIW